MNQPLNSLDSDTDQRMDSLARMAGREVRTAAPANGFAGVRRARRNQQLSRTGGATAIVALLAISGTMLVRNGSERTIRPADTVKVTTPVVVVETSLPTPQTVAAESDTAALFEPAQIYAPGPDVVTQTVIDPITALVTGTAPVDDALSQQVLAGREAAASFRTQSASGEYDYDWHTTQNLDACNQTRLLVGVRPEGGLATGAMPSHVLAATMTADGRGLLAAWTDCFTTSAPPGTSTVNFQIFDADNPQLPGRNLDVYTTAAGSSWQVTLDDSGQFAVITAMYPATSATLADFAVTDLTTGLPVDILGNCLATGLQSQRTTAGSMGQTPPGIIRNHVLAFTTICPDGTHHAVLQSLANTSERIVVDIPDAGPNDGAAIELDYSSLESTSTAWFVVRTGPAGQLSTRSFVGHGADPLREIVGVDSATFLPQWSPGG